MSVKVLLFDLGGVLVGYDGISPLVNLTHGALTKDDAQSFWERSFWMEHYETGKCSTEEFLKGIAKELNIQIPPARLLKEFESWELGPFEGSLELLDQLRQIYPIGCLSNNNPIHWGYLDKNFALGEKFQHCFLSYRIGFVKPNKEIYLHVIDKLNIKPQNIHFFDDKPANVDGARAVGISAYCVNGVDETKQKLNELFFSF
ncbi:HAD family phosphatase [candidate division KSB1 bacterium]|nr:HAD family phosphatase [candidate division KSB1 bacterium]